MIELSLIQKIAIWVIPVILAITVHEVAHGWVASKFGDQTARLAGRLTLNPISHIDVMGTLVIPMLLLAFSNFIFGWAKPVPVDARNMRNPRWNMVFVAAAGPLANLIMALGWAGIAKLGLHSNAWFGVPLIGMGQAGMMINIILAVLNCLPIPPLDGGQMLSNLLPPRIGWQLDQLQPYGLLILILLMFTGVLSFIMWPIVSFLFNGIAMLFGLG